MEKNTNIAALNSVGQSVWIDNVSRRALSSGELAAVVDVGVSGLTSNPTIFKQAIADSADYDGDIRALAAKGMNAEQICEELMVGDVQGAADLLRGAFDRSHGADGHASIEVSPDLAHDTERTVEAARRLWKKLGRPNVMIKVPATKEGIPAVRTLLEEGINVNITLIFSESVYREVAQAYLGALERRSEKGGEIGGIASVASFFVSRVDAIHEKRFDDLVAKNKATEGERETFWGKVGIANSKIAYAAFEELFRSARFEKLAKRGARVQRPLWASTGTKNPKFSPVLYVEELAGSDTVNTMPPQTLQALMKGATIESRIARGVDEARALIDRVKGLGLPFDDLLDELQRVGVTLFADSYRDLLSSITAKMTTR